jgi:hypothetical protein
VLVTFDGRLSDICSSVATRPVSPSLNALTLTGATVGTIAVDAVALVMGVIEGRMEEADFDVAGVVAGVDPKEVLEDFMACD